MASNMFSRSSYAALEAIAANPTRVASNVYPSVTLRALSDRGFIRAAQQHGAAVWIATGKGYAALDRVARKKVVPAYAGGTEYKMRGPAAQKAKVAERPSVGERAAIEEAVVRDMDKPARSVTRILEEWDPEPKQATTIPSAVVGLTVTLRVPVTLLLDKSPDAQHITQAVNEAVLANGAGKFLHGWTIDEVLSGQNCAIKAEAVR